jgi:sulfoxide reductase heme-binding subunit YedZ
MGDLEFWFIARITGLTAFAVLSLAVLSGEALRTSVLDFLAKNRAIRRLHDFTTPLWLPLVFAHIIALLLDKTAAIQPVNIVVPFVTTYQPYLIPIGLGTVAFDIIMVVTVTSWLRSRMNNTLWMWIHRTSYIAFVAIFFHAALSGTDFDAPLVSALAWSTAAGLAILGISRIVWGRLPA